MKKYFIFAIAGTILAASSLAAPISAPDDFLWAAGAFADATPSETAAWQSLLARTGASKRERTAAVLAELKKTGNDAPALEPDCYGEPTCALIESIVRVAADVSSGAEFRQGAAAARPAFRSYLAAVANAEAIVAERDQPTLRERLIAMTMGEQMLRALRMGTLETEAGLSAPAARVGANVLKWAEIAKRDHANTAALKAIIAESGWPARSTVGKDGGKAAWLIVQHADDDPAFQIAALGLIEKAMLAGEADPTLYAYLYDRVVLKTRGKQRYGSQFVCKDNKYVVSPLEDTAKLDSYRQAVGMPPIAVDQKRLPPAC